MKDKRDFNMNDSVSSVVLTASGKTLKNETCRKNDYKERSYGAVLHSVLYDYSVKQLQSVL